MDDRLVGQIRKDFAEHIATVREFEGITEIIWGTKDGSSVYRIVYLIWKNRLFVCGDLGEAVYGWSQKINLNFLAGCNLDYFAEKCEASEEGRGFKTWSREKARKFIEDFPNSHISKDETQRLALFSQMKEELMGAASHREEWQRVIGSDEGSELFGDDWWEYGDIGMDIHPCCTYHLTGLKMVFEQTKAKTSSMEEEKYV